MEGILKVTPEKLIQASGTFATTGTQVKNCLLYTSDAADD